MFNVAAANEKMDAWIDCHVQALNYLGKPPAVIVPDNTSTATYRPKKNSSFRAITSRYADFADYHDITVVPTRPGKPRDKAAVERAVQIAYNRILGYFHGEQFYNLDELNKAIAERLVDVNDVMPRRDGSTRQQRFDEDEAPMMRDRACPPDGSHRGFNQEADLRIAGPRSPNATGARYPHQECRRTVLYLVHQRKTSRRQINWLAKVLESWSASRFFAALKDSARALSALVPINRIDSPDPEVLADVLEWMRGVNTAIIRVENRPLQASTLALGHQQCLFHQARVFRTCVS